MFVLWFFGVRRNSGFNSLYAVPCIHAILGGFVHDLKIMPHEALEVSRTVIYISTHLDCQVRQC